MSAVAAALDAAHFLSWCFPALLCWNSKAGQFRKPCQPKCKIRCVLIGAEHTLTITVNISSYSKALWLRFLCFVFCFFSSERSLRMRRRRRRQHLLAGCGLMAAAGGFLPLRLIQLPTDRRLNGRRLMHTELRVRTRCHCGFLVFFPRAVQNLHPCSVSSSHVLLIIDTIFVLNLPCTLPKIWPIFTLRPDVELHPFPTTIQTALSAWQHWNPGLHTWPAVVCHRLYFQVPCNLQSSKWHPAQACFHVNTAPQCFFLQRSWSLLTNLFFFFSPP